ncbi:hypothetical protein SANTM175S_02720 [Streptomyces antimycoticus]
MISATEEAAQQHSSCAACGRRLYEWGGGGRGSAGSPRDDGPGIAPRGRSVTHTAWRSTMTTIARTRRYSQPEQEFIARQDALPQLHHQSPPGHRLAQGRGPRPADLDPRALPTPPQPRRRRRRARLDHPYQARIVLRRHLSPVPAGDANWWYLTQILGHSSEWPEHWHRVLVDEGQAALLRLRGGGDRPDTSRCFRRPARAGRGGRLSSRTSDHGPDISAHAVDAQRPWPLVRAVRRRQPPEGQSFQGCLYRPLHRRNL